MSVSPFENHNIGIVERALSNGARLLKDDIFFSALGVTMCHGSCFFAPGQTFSSGSRGPGRNPVPRTTHPVHIPVVPG